MKSLKLETKEQQDCEKSVKEHMDALGSQEFKYASKRLRSDAEFIIDLVEQYPEILSWTEDEIHERFVNRFGKFVDNADGRNLFFAMICCGKNIDCYKYIDEKSAKAYYERVKSGYVKQGEYLGYYYRCFVALDEVDNVLSQLTKIRPEITDMVENNLEV